MTEVAARVPITATAGARVTNRLSAVRTRFYAVALACCLTRWLHGDASVRAGLRRRTAVQWIRNVLTALLLVSGLVAGAGAAFATGVAGNALQFDGGADDVGDLVRIPDDASLTFLSHTLEAWILVDDLDFSAATVISKGGQTGNYSLGLLGAFSENPGAVLYTHELAGAPGAIFVLESNIPGTPRVPIDTWTHVAATFDAVSREGRVYVNGVLTGTAIAKDLPRPNTGDLLFGAAQSQTGAVGAFHRGLMDEVRIWDVPRTDQQIAEGHARIVNSNTPGLVGYWNFNETIADQTVFDLAAFGGQSNGTLGSDNLASADDPTRIDSVAPLFADFAACPANDGEVARIFADAGPAARDSYILAYTPGTSDSGLENNQAAGLCPGPGFDPANGGSVRTCATIATDPEPCFPPDPAAARDAFGMQTQQRISASGSVCTIHCFTIDSMRVCQEVCLPP